MQYSKKKIVIIGAASGILGSFVDIFGTYFYGDEINKFSQLRNTMSQMAIFKSHVADKIDDLWIIMGLLFIVFGLTIRFTFIQRKKYTILASWLVIVYGVGEGIGSGIFPVDKIGHSSWIGIIHNSVGGLGVLSLLIFPLVMAKLIPNLKKFTVICFVVELISIILFFISQILNNPGNLIVIYKGLWQRLYVISFYIYLITSALIIIKQTLFTTNINYSNTLK